MKQILKRMLQIIIVVAAICIVVLWVYKNVVYPRKYKDIVEQACSIYNVDPNLIYAVIKQESKFNPNAVSHSGAKGLMQLIDTTAQDMAENTNSIDKNNLDIYDPYTNIFLGTKYISYLINHFDGNYYLAITAYNAGMGNTKAWLKKEYTDYTTFSDVYECIEYSETKNYLNNVINNYNYYTRLYE